jgi:hypothetical protein
MIRGPISQAIVHFVAASADGFRMHSCDLCNALESTVSQTYCLAARHPATLLLVQTTQQQIQLPMVTFLCVIACHTLRTTTLMNRLFLCHRQISFPGVAESLHSNSDFTK